MCEDIIEWILDNANAFTNVNGDLQVDVSGISELSALKEQILDTFGVTESEEFDDFWENRVEKDLGYMMEVIFPLN